MRPPRLETIYEEGESKCSSLTSLAVAKQQALTFYNQDAIATVESGEKETEMGSSKDIIREPDVEGTVSIVNKSALDQDSSSDEELRDKGKVQSSDVSSGTRKQTPSFSNRTALERESSEEDKATKKGAVPAIHLASDVSSSSARRHTLSFSNRTALERENSGEDKTTTKGAVLTVGLASDVSGSPRKHALSFSNRTALERENSEEGKATNDSGKLERGTDITASFRRPVPLGKMNEKEAPNIQTSSRGSPFLQHIPRGAFVSPADVKGMVVFTIQHLKIILSFFLQFHTQQIGKSQSLHRQESRILKVVPQLTEFVSIICKLFEKCACKYKPHLHRSCLQEF